MVAQKYRWDFIGLSTDEKPTAETSPKVTDGSTFYCSDTSQLYVWCNDQWYEKTATGGGGGDAPTVVQTTGTSTTDVMSQNAVTSMVFADPGTNERILLGNTATNTSPGSVVIGKGASSSQSSGEVVIGKGAHAYNGDRCIVIGEVANSGSNCLKGVALGYFANVGTNSYSVALGSEAVTSRSGEVNIGTGTNSHGYNNTNYRVIGGVHDGQLAQDAVTVNQVNSVIDAINTALSTNIPHIGA